MSNGAAPTPEQAREAAEMMRKNPEMVKQAAEMMKNMSPEELERLTGMPGAPPGMTPEMIKASVGMLFRRGILVLVLLHLLCRMK